MLFQLACASKKGLVKPDSNLADKEEALILFKEGALALYNDNELAVKKFNQAKEIDKDLLPAFYNAGLAYEQLGLVQDAINNYQECTEKDPINESCLYNLLLNKYKSGEVQYCEDLVAKYVAEYPEKSLTKVALAKLFYLKNDLENAQKNALLALEIETENAEALYPMLRIFYFKKQYRAAKFVAQNALKISPRHAGILLYQGHTFKALENYQEALESYEKAVKYEPLSEALENYSKVLLKVGKNQEALKQAEKLVSLTPTDSSNMLLLGNAYLANRDLEKAQEIYEKVIELNNKSAHFNLGLLYFDFKQEKLSELDRYKKSQFHFKEFSTLETASKDKLDETKNYIEILDQKIASEIQLQSFDDETQEEEKSEEEDKKEDTQEEEKNEEPVQEEDKKEEATIPEAKNEVIEENKEIIEKEPVKKKKKKKAKKKKKKAKVVDEYEEDIDDSEDLDKDVDEDY